MLGNILQKIKRLLRDETVLTVAAILAVVSVFVIPPDAAYAGYVDVRVLALLFCLMLAMAGFQEQGIFKALAEALLSKAKSYRQLCLVLVFLCFFSAMIITNDVALITFVPFTITILNMAGARKQIMTVVVLQTIAANLGSMMTPIGNPQNLYLYAGSGMEMGEFLKLMFPVTLISGIMLFVCCILQKQVDIKLGALGRSTDVDEQLKLGQEAAGTAGPGGAGSRRRLLTFYTLVFALSLLTVFHVVHYVVPLTFTVIGALIIHRQILKKADYNLLLTFISFFVFIGNMGRIPAVSAWLSQVLEGRELLVAFLCSQVISNVPAAVLLSGFTGQWDRLLLGVNIGGLGTLIASMASLISYKLYVKEMPESKAQYFRCFTMFNIGFAVVLLAAVLGLN